MTHWRLSLRWLLLLTVCAVPSVVAAQTFELTVTFPGQGCVWTGPLFVTNTAIQAGWAPDVPFVRKRSLTDLHSQGTHRGH